MGIVSHDHQVGAPRTFPLGGKGWPVSGLTPYQLGQIEAHLKDAFPSPLAELRDFFKGAGDAFTPEERAELLREAKARMEPAFDAKGVQTGGWPIGFNSRVGQQYLFAGRGLGAFLLVVLSKHTPGLPRAEAERLGALCTTEDLRALTELIQVRSPDGEEPGDGDPDEDDDAHPEGYLPEGYVDPKG